MRPGVWATLSVQLVYAAIMGCATKPQVQDGVVVAEPLPAASPELSPRAVFEQTQRERALNLVRQKRLADAALAWEVLTVLRPDVDDYRERLTDTQRQIDAAVAERLPRAAQAAQRGESDSATQLYLAVLALQPLNEPAAEAMRALERERNKRSYLGKFSRYTLTRRAIADAEMTGNVNLLTGRNDVEHAALLAGDGEFDDAIGLLERRLATDKQDAAARRMLASVYYRKAESLLPRDSPGAIAALEKSVRVDPSDPRAMARLKQLKGGSAKPPAVGASAASAVAKRAH